MTITYELKHITTYRYTAPVSMCQNQLRLTPRTDCGQTLLKHRIDVLPKPVELSRSEDYFGNQLSYFELHQPHDQLTVSLSGLVRVERPEPDISSPSPAWEQIVEQLRSDRSPNGLKRYQLAFPSPMIPVCEAATIFAQTKMTRNRPILETIVALNQAIHEQFEYDPTATTIATPLGDVFRMKRGVCQDLAHVGIACARAVGLSARYVSGYLRTYRNDSQNAMVGADASHAWLSIWAGDYGWIDIDPTNDLVVAEEHVTLAWGRDFRDVTPINGLFVGADQQSLDVAVRLTPKPE